MHSAEFHVHTGFPARCPEPMQMADNARGRNLVVDDRLK
jgi:hypothetical protein